jgi:hypothetical protein
MSISIESFNANFLIHIRSIAKPHIDETGIIPADIGFNIVCVPNNRVQFFEYHIMDQNVVDTSNDQQLVDIAWAALKSDIQTWASTAINKNNLIGYIYTPTSEFNNTFGNLNLTTYNTNFTTQINRFEVHPLQEPNSWSVGFQITNSIGESMYANTIVPVETFAVTSAEQDIMDNAWDNLKDSICIWASSNIGLSSLLNSVYTPSTF